MTTSSANSTPTWARRWSVCLVGATFPLIWIGGLVTSYQAGMAVADWPSTYGYNLFLYPWQTWLFGPWDIFVEHGHRLMGGLVGLLAIGLCAAVWSSDRRPVARWSAAAVLALVIAQGVLGGLRVLWDDRSLAMVHAIIAPVFFVLAVCTAAVHSRWWREQTALEDDSAPRVQRLTLITTGLVFAQLLLGAQVRHIDVMAPPGWFRMVVFFHLFLAVVIAFHAWRLNQMLAGVQPRQPWLVRPGRWLLVLVGVQILLGLGSWLVKYGPPAELTGVSLLAGFTVEARTFGQKGTLTAHVAVGALMLAMASLCAVRSGRLLRPRAAAIGSGVVLMGCAS